MSRPLSLCLGVLMVLLTNCAPGVADDDAQTRAEKERLCRAAITAFVANLRSFRFYETEYLLMEGKAQSVEEAIQGRIQNARVYRNRLLVDGDKELYEALTPSPGPAEVGKGTLIDAKKGLYSVAAPLVSGKVLADGKSDLSYEPAMRSVNLHSWNKSASELPFTPLGLFRIGHGQRYYGPDALLAKLEEYEFVPEGASEVDSRLLITSRFRGKPKEYGSIVFSLDPSRGYLPVRIVSLPPPAYPNIPTSLCVVTDVRECSNQRWFPDRILDIHGPGPDGHYRVREMRIEKLEVDKRPDPASFTITVAAGTQVLDFDDDALGHCFVFKQDERVSTDDISKLFSMLEKKKTNPLMDTAIPHPWLPAWSRWLGGGVGLLLAFGAGLFLVRRFRKKLPA